MNHKKMERIYYRDEGLSLRRRRGKQAAAVPRPTLPRPTRPRLCYAMNFVHDRLVTGRRFKCLTMTDLCSKEAPVIEVDIKTHISCVALLLHVSTTTYKLAVQYRTCLERCSLGRLLGTSANSSTIPPPGRRIADAS